MSYASINPFDGRKLQDFDDHSDADIKSMIDRAHTAYTRHWSTRSVEDRKTIVKKVAALLRDRREEMAQSVTLEMGKLIAEARAEVDLSADILDYYADSAASFLANQTLKIATGEAFVESAPMGVLFCIEPWNFPYYQLARVAGPNVMAGNTLIVKHAPNVPRCALAFARLFTDAGAPEGVYENVFATNEQAARIIEDPRIIGVALTGGVRAGTTVASEAGRAMKKSTMELGGSDAFIVLEDADLDLAVKEGVWAKMNNTGECCIAAKRYILHEKVADEYITRFKAELEKLAPGDPMEDGTKLGPLCTDRALSDALAQIKTAVDGGAKLLLGGRRIDRPGYYLEPTIITNMRPENPAYHEEIFAPVAIIFRVPDEDRAIELANDSPYGLGGTIMTKDVERGKRMARRIESGMVFINKATWTAPDLPFGGIKNSGYGRELAEAGMGEFVNKKLVRVA